ncbi:hypothetical protein QBE52_03725 [Clostridiaceae bacterium 35-E11]
MNGFMNKLFGRKNNKKAASNSKILSEMPENVLYGEDTGAIPPDDMKNQLENEIKD